MPTAARHASIISSPQPAGNDSNNRSLDASNIFRVSRAAAVDYLNVAEDRLVSSVNEAIRSQAWIAAPDEADSRFRQVWRAVSIELQTQLRAWLLADYFEDIGRCSRRLCAHTLLVYAASQPYQPPQGSFEFVRDPADPGTLNLVRDRNGRALRILLSDLYPRIHAAGMPELASRYRPELYEDIRRDVLRRPESLLKLIAAEGILIDTIITLGAGKGAAEVRNFVKLARRRLRIGTKGQDWTIDQQRIYIRALEETSRQLQQI